MRRLRLAVLWGLSSGAVFALVIVSRMASDSLLARWKMGGGDWLQTASQALFVPTALVFLPVPMVGERFGVLVAALCLGVWGALLLLAVRAVVRRRRAA